MSTHNLYFEQNYEKISEFLFENFLFLGGKIFSIFEYAYFRNEAKLCFPRYRNGLNEPKTNKKIKFLL